MPDVLAGPGDGAKALRALSVAGIVAPVAEECSMSALAARMLAESPDAVAPDGTAVRLLTALSGGSFAHFELPAGAVSHAVTHRTVEEIWYFVAGRGRIWRRLGDAESLIEAAPGLSLTIPLGAHFQFRADEAAPLAFVAATMPPWPGADEAVVVDGPWTPTVP